MKINDTEITDQIIREGENVKIVHDPETKQIIIGATMAIKHGPFTVAGKVIEIQAGSNIRISTASPNKLIIGADFGKETARIKNLEDRVENFEKAIGILLNER